VRPAADRLRRGPALPGPVRGLRGRAGHPAGPGGPGAGRGRGLPAGGRAGRGRAGRTRAALGAAPGTRRDRRGSGAALLSAGRAGEPSGGAAVGGRLGGCAGRRGAPGGGLRPVHPHVPPAPHPCSAAGHRRPRLRHRRAVGRANHHRRRPQADHPRPGGPGHHHRPQHQRTRGRGDRLGRRAHHPRPDHPPRRPPGPAQLLPAAGRAGPPAGRAGPPSPGIARRLHAEGFRPAKGRQRIGISAITQLLHQLGCPRAFTRERITPPPGEEPRPHEWWLDDLAAELAMPPITLHSWIRRGWVSARQESRRPYRWIIHADGHQLAELRQRRSRPPGWYTRRRWADSKPPAHNGSRDHAASPHI
jgi:hypothetical protein